MDRNIGDVLEANDRTREAGYHYIIFYIGYSDDEFLAGILTSTNKYHVNILMDESHFINTDENGNDFKVTYKNSKLVPAKLYKPENWGPFEKVGQLSAEGIAFVEDKIGHLEAEFWEEYILK
ncbi:hypothetical protein [Flavobacterium sp.]|uniref:hypothetical protein n=1 Tax=Flavobacterium sp. TaxID=239 RepID=UPI00286F6503|nr:hypothetical protein [Flavobacterium sp.]